MFTINAKCNGNPFKVHKHTVQRILNMDNSLDAWLCYADIKLKIIDYKCGENNRMTTNLIRE